MPSYTFQCEDCSETYNVFRKMSDISDVLCNKCSKKCKRVFNSVPVLFKGSGFPDADEKKIRNAQIESSTPRKHRSSAEEKVTQVYEDKLRAKDEKLKQ